MHAQKKRHVTFKILLFLLSIDLIETVAQFCFKKSTLASSVLSSPLLWAGLVCVFIIVVMWSTVLSRLDLSVAVPVCSFSYITIPLASMVFLHEKISFTRWIGIFLILCGVILVAISSMQKKEQRA